MFYTIGTRHLILFALLILSVACSRPNASNQSDLNGLFASNGSGSNSASPNNSPARAFGANGLAALSAKFQVSAVKVQADGKIVVGGYASQAARKLDFFLLRLTAAGELDTEFGDDGLVRTHFGHGDDTLTDIALAEDGSIFALGYGHNGVNLDVALAKYTKEGRLDESFGMGGRVLTDARPNLTYPDDFGRALLLQPDGKILVVGDTHENCQNLLIRYLPDGKLDTSFGASKSGIIIHRFNGWHDTFDAVALMADGTIIAAGTLAEGRDFALARYTRDGLLDTTFANQGKFILDLNTVDQTTQVAVRPNGSIVVMGYSGTSTDQQLIVFELDSKGVLEKSFGMDGIFAARYQMNAGLNRLYDGMLLSDGSILAAGQFQAATGLTSGMIKLTANGALDPAFGTAGMASYKAAGVEAETGHAVALSGNQLYLVSNVRVPAGLNVLVRKLNMQGAIIP